MKKDKPRKAITFAIKEETIIALKHKAIDLKITQSKLVELALQEFLSKREKPKKST